MAEHLELEGHFDRPYVHSTGTSRELNLLLTIRPGEELRALAGEVRAVLSIVESAAPSPPLMSMFDDVYAERAWFLEEQASEAATFHASETSGD